MKSNRKPYSIPLHDFSSHEMKKPKNGRNQRGKGISPESRKEVRAVARVLTQVATLSRKGATPVYAKALQKQAETKKRQLTPSQKKKIDSIRKKFRMPPLYEEE